MSVVAWLTALGLLLAAIRFLLFRYIGRVGSRLARNPISEQRLREALHGVDGIYIDGDQPRCRDCKVAWDGDGDRCGLIPCPAHKPRGRHHAEPATDQFTAADWDAIESWGNAACQPVPCTNDRPHDATECNGYHLDESDL